MPDGRRQLWERAGIRFVGDVCHPNEGRLLSHEEINSKFGTRSSFLEALALRLSVPLRWRSSLSDDWTEPPGLASLLQIKIGEEDPLNLANLSSKGAYLKLISKTTVPNAAYARWTEEDGELSISDRQEWSQVSLRPFTSIRETKIQSFQYKLINRITPCRAYLRQLRIFDSDECPFCRQADTLPHFFFDCPNTRSFWERIHQWTNRVEDLRLDTISKKEILLGVPTEYPKSRVINTILLFTKYFIHRQKLFYNGELSLIHWLQELKARLNREKWICARLGTASKFAPWAKYLDHLS